LFAPRQGGFCACESGAVLVPKRLKTGRIMILGAKAEYRRRGIFALFAHEMFRRGRAFGAVGAEASWILEDNDKLNRPLEAMGAKEYRRWRIYDRAISSVAAAR